MRKHHTFSRIVQLIELDSEATNAYTATDALGLAREINLRRNAVAHEALFDSENAGQRLWADKALRTRPATKMQKYTRRTQLTHAIADWPKYSTLQAQRAERPSNAHHQRNGSTMKMTAYEFASSIETRIESLSNEQYHNRVRPAKRLIEELYPLSRLALAFKQPGLDVHVEANENSGRADGHIWLSGYIEKDFEVQVTFAGYGEKDALRSALLVQQGFAPGAGPIDKIAGEIVAVMEAQDYDAPIKPLAASIRERTLAKAAKKYAPETVLIVAFEDMRLRGCGWWKWLYAAIENVGGIERGNFAQVYLFNGCSNEFQQVA
ncbi:hypothetical protein FHW83_000617 [Duganella sp. SG902]|uniref:hypothetical protein n=1 Tax=Duganella sp. SG902 TaxID=2587016 RepID=UPI00159DB88B|nr:hypothetical protein [Duganella sp. SG902]NVM74857.1 hypothetical protein [Duganella sp. SG902]